VLRAQLQIAQSMFTIGWALALGARLKQLPMGVPAAARATAAAAKPVQVAAVANAQRRGGRKRRTMRRP